MKSGRKEHEMMEKKERHEKRAKGGRTMKEPSEGKVKDDERTKEMVAEEKEGHKRGGKVEGKEPKERLDKRARGGRMTPKDPFSGASVKSMPYESKLAKQGTQAKGSSVRPS